MCGVYGSLSFHGLSDHAAAITARLTALMKRRGPDDEGVWTDGKHCSLGFRRLSILDLSPSGHQPMLTPDGRYALVHNGEVYNFQELRDELAARGLRVRSTGDTEVILNLLAQSDRAGLNRLNGMFALAFYDTRSTRLLLARDHAGIKPLYYLLTSEGLVFASQYDLIMSHPWANRLPVSRDALALYLRLGYIPAPFALLENTYMLEPGAWLEVNADGQTTRGSFYEFPRFREPDLRGDAAYEAVDAAVTRAVRRQLVSDVPLGTFLSGGIDSPLVTAKMRAASSGPVHAFTLGTNHDHLDESSDAIRYARDIGVEHTVEHVTPDMALAMLDDVVTACGEPFADYSIFPTMLIARLARRRVTVMLSGDGGDELFWGYAGRFASVLDESNDSRRPPPALFKRLLRSSDRRAWTIGDRYRAKHTRISDTSLNRIFLDPPAWPRGFELFAYAGGGPGTTAQWLRWNEFVGHLTMVLLKVDRASMYHSLEVRVPLLDREVIDVAVRIDWASCLDTKRRVGKMPLRAALARHVSHQTTTKRGFEVPMSAWLRGPLQAVFEEAVLDRKEILDMPLDRRELRRMFHRHVSNRGEQASGLWTLLGLALWEEKHYRHRSSTFLRPNGS